MRSSRTKHWLLLITLTLLLTGCVNADLHITVNKDGSGIYEVKILTNKLLLPQFQNLKQRLTDHGYRLQDIRQGKLVGWVAVKQVKNISEEPPGPEFQDSQSAFHWFAAQTASAGAMPAASPETPHIRQLGKGFQIHPGLFTTTITYDANVDLRGMRKNDWMGLDQFLFDQMNLNFILTLPVKVDEHNATSVSPDGKTLTWKIRPGEENPIHMAIRFPNPLTWSVLILTGIILLTVWIIRRIRRKRKGDPPASDFPRASFHPPASSPDAFHWEG
jgi:hypothetical protein